MKKLKGILFLDAFEKTLTGSDLILKQRLRLFKITTGFSLLLFISILYQFSLIRVSNLLMVGIISFLFFAVFINYFSLSLHKNSKISFAVLVSLLFLTLHFISYNQGGIRNSGMFYLSAVIFVSYILLGKLGGSLMALVSMLHVVYLYLISIYTNWTDYSLIGTDPGLIDFDFFITGVFSIIILKAQVNYVERRQNAFINDIKCKTSELAIKNEELLNSQKALHLKNKELEQFAYIASHDLQEPLRTTSSFVGLLQQQYMGKLDDKADKYLRFISQSSERMKILIKDLLEYSRIGRKQEWVQVDCNIILQALLSDLDVVIKENKAEIQINSLPVVKGYSTEIKLLFQNLILNAIKFKKKEEVPVINISANKKNNYWEFCCRDNGIGINEKHNERIFIIFQRLHTRNEYEGSGIGLSHCKKIVELHNGRIWVESTSGNGSAFYFTLEL